MGQPASHPTEAEVHTGKLFFSDSNQSCVKRRTNYEIHHSLSYWKHITVNEQLTKQQKALLAWCEDHAMRVDFTTTTTAIVYLRMAGKWRVGEMEYHLYNDKWCPRVTKAISIDVRG